MANNKTYTIIVYLRGNKIIKSGVDELNSHIIPAEMRLRCPKAFKKGIISVSVVEEQ